MTRHEDNECFTKRYHECLLGYAWLVSRFIILSMQTLNMNEYED